MTTINHPPGAFWNRSSTTSESRPSVLPVLPVLLILSAVGIPRSSDEESTSPGASAGPWEAAGQIFESNDVEKLDLRRFEEGLKMRFLWILVRFSIDFPVAFMKVMKFIAKFSVGIRQAKDRQEYKHRHLF